MTESEFARLAGEILARIEDALDKSDIDYENNGGVLDMEFANGSHIVVNKQSANQEIWLAAKSGGYHFARRDDAWLDTRDGSEFFTALSREATIQAGQPVKF